MAEPASLPEWDTNETNMAVPTAELLDGWTVGQKPPSGFFNWWMNLVYIWIVYFRAANPYTRTLQIPLAPAFQGTPLSDVGVTSGGPWTIPLSLEVGKKIVAIRARIKDTNTTTLRMNFVTVTDGSASTTSLFTSAASGVNQTLSVTAAIATIAHNISYEIMFDLSSGTGTCHLYCLEVDYTP